MAQKLNGLIVTGLGEVNGKKIAGVMVNIETNVGKQCFSKQENIQLEVSEETFKQVMDEMKSKALVELAKREYEITE